MGKLDEDGYLYIVDRTKDMISVGGYKVFSLMVEEVQHQHPAIEMCAIIGVPNPERIGDQQELFSGITGTLQFINEPTLA